jgi:GNAT superfamily N-acetyltransferase
VATVSSPDPDPGWLDAARALASRRWRAPAYWHPGGLTWDLATSDPAQLEAWYDDGRPTAWAMLDGRGHVSAQCDRSLDSAGDLAAAVVGWAAASPAGLLAATCTAWLDPDSRSGELEPVGTNPRHRRLGLASAVCLAAMHSLAGLGATDVTVHPRGDAGYPAARVVYERIGFAAVGRTVAYWLERLES